MKSTARQDLQDARVELDLGERLQTATPSSRLNATAAARRSLLGRALGAPARLGLLLGLGRRRRVPCAGGCRGRVGRRRCSRRGAGAGALVAQLRLELVGDELVGDLVADDQRRVPVLGGVRGAELGGLLERVAVEAHRDRSRSRVGRVQPRERGEVLLGALAERERRQRVVGVGVVRRRRAGPASRRRTGA